MGLMDIFAGFRQGTSNLPQTNPQQQNTAPGGSPQIPANPNPQQQNSNHTIPNANNSAPSDGSQVAAIPASGQGDQSPLAKFGDLFKVDPNAKPTNTPTTSVPSMEYDPVKLMEAAKTIDFSKAINQDTLLKAAKGDPTALSEVINSAAQAGFAQATGVSTKLIKNALDAQEKTFRDSILPQILREQSIQQAPTTAPLADNPAVAPILSMLETQMASKYPNARPAEIKELAGNFMTELANAMITSQGGTVTSRATTQQAAAKETDWSSFLNG